MGMSEDLESVKTEICDKYCRYPRESRVKWLMDDPESDPYDYMVEHYCKECPLTRL